jgi:hypothetical protein
MTYVWIKENEGSLRYVNDIYLPPCNVCGERMSTCSCKQDAEEAEEKEEMCPSCNGRCFCDENYDRMRERENEDRQDSGDDD